MHQLEKLGDNSGSEREEVNGCERVDAEVVSTSPVIATLTTKAVLVAQSVNEEHRLAQRCRDNAVEHAIRCGQLLTEQKARLHGSFTRWVIENCEFSGRTSRAYMQAAAQAGPLSSSGSTLPLTSIRALLAPVSTKPKKSWQVGDATDSTSARSTPAEIVVAKSFATRLETLTAAVVAIEDVDDVAAGDAFARALEIDVLLQRLVRVGERLLERETDQTGKRKETYPSAREAQPKPDAASEAS